MQLCHNPLLTPSSSVLDAVNHSYTRLPLFLVPRPRSSHHRPTDRISFRRRLHRHRIRLLVAARLFQNTL